MDGSRPQAVILDEVPTPEQMLAAASEGLLERLPSQPPRLIACPFCQGGISFSPYSYLWGHTCWICSGWAVVTLDKQYLRGPIAPHPSRMIR